MNARAMRFPLLDSMRAIAMLVVLMAHVAAPAGAREGAALTPYFNRLAVGLTMFFCISGFLLYRPWVRSRVLGKPRPAVAAYAWGRVLRILPAYWVALTVTTIWLSSPGVFTVEGIPTYYGFAQIYSNTTALGGIAVAWSLDIEVLFYIFLPLYAWVVVKLPGRLPGSKLAGEWAAIAVLFAISLVYKVVVASTGLHESSAALISLPAYLDWLAAGMALGVLSVALEQRARDRPEAGHPGWLRVVDRFPIVPWLVAFFLFWMVSQQIGINGRFPQPDEIGYLLEHLFYLGVAVGLLVPAMFGDPGRGLVRRLLANRALTYLGMISYGIFLYHIAVIEQLKDWDLGSVGVIHPYVLWFGTALAGSAAIATVSWYLLEKPALSLKRLVGPRREPQPGEATAEPTTEPLAVSR
jgi:peptidoglycan/LPS O-acetylase OafA/YrhL